MEITLTYKDEEKEEALLALKASKYLDALSEIHSHLIRPHRKHGYSQPQLAEMFTQHEEILTNWMELFEKHFFEILNEHEVSLD